MPYRQRDSVYWWISYTDPSGHRVRCSSGTTDHAQARALEQAQRANGYATRVASTGQLLDAVVAEYLAPRLSARTRSTARHLAAHLAGRTVESLDAAAIHGYLVTRQEEGAAPATINKELAMLSAAINAWNLKHGTTLPNRASRAKLPEPAGVVRWITQDEAQRLIAAASPPVADFIRIGLYTGLRAEALLTLEWSDIDFERGLIIVRPKLTPRAKPRARSIPIHPTCRDGLLSCRMRCATSCYVFCAEDSERHILSFKKGFAAACRRAQIESFRIHDMRHTFASWLVIAGRPLAEVRDLLGHSSIRQTEIYAHLAPENLRAAVASLS
jgi:integrase